MTILTLVGYCLVLVRSVSALAGSSNFRRPCWSNPKCFGPRKAPFTRARTRLIPKVFPADVACSCCSVKIFPLPLVSNGIEWLRNKSLRSECRVAENMTRKVFWDQPRTRLWRCYLQNCLDNCKIPKDRTVVTRKEGMTVVAKVHSASFAGQFCQQFSEVLPKVHVGSHSKNVTYFFWNWEHDGKCRPFSWSKMSVATILKFQSSFSSIDLTIARRASSGLHLPRSLLWKKCNSYWITTARCCLATEVLLIRRENCEIWHDEKP